MTVSGRTNDIICGLAVAAIGLFAFWSAIGWDLGSMRRIGPAVFPAAVGLILIFVGLAIALLEGRDPDALPALDPPVNIRGLVFVVAAMIAFTALIRTAGLLPATWAAVLLASRADSETSLASAFIVATIMSVIGLGLFVHLLGFQARAFGAY